MNPGDDSTEAQDRDLDTLEDVLATGGTGLLPADTQRRVDTLLTPGQGLEPASRHRLIEAAARATRRHRQDTIGHLETLLFDVRRNKKLTTAELADTLEITESAIRKIEQGKLLLQSQTAPVVAKWATSLDLTVIQVDGPLRRSLIAAAAGDEYAGRSQTDLDQEAATYLHDVIAAMEQQQRQTDQ